jgi:hypothetical protein
MHTSQLPRLEAEDPYLFGCPPEQRQEQPDGATHVVKHVAAKQQLTPLALLSPFLLNHLSFSCCQVSKPHVCQVLRKALLAAGCGLWPAGRGRESDLARFA